MPSRFSPSTPPSQYQGFQVQLESVKKLRDLERQSALSPRLQAQRLLPVPCYHPALPRDLQPICTSREAASIFKALRECPHPWELPALIPFLPAPRSGSGSSTSCYFY